MIIQDLSGWLAPRSQSEALSAYRGAMTGHAFRDLASHQAESAREAREEATQGLAYGEASPWLSEPLSRCYGVKLPRGTAYRSADGLSAFTRATAVRLAAQTGGEVHPIGG